jgi:CheY-specific phosphatase CheX
MPDNADQALVESSIKIFAELSFQMAYAELSEEQKNAAVRAAACVEFTGPLAGRLVLRVAGDAADRIAVNMLGEEKEVSAAMRRDAVKEVANVIAGHFLPAYSGSSAPFRLLASVLSPDEPLAAPEGFRQEASVSFGIDDGRADVALYLAGAR